GARRRRGGVRAGLVGGSQPVGQVVDEFGDPGRAVQCVQRGGGPVAIVVVPHQDWYTLNITVAHRVERVLVGDVVAEIDRHQGGVRPGQVIDHPAQRSAL